MHDVIVAGAGPVGLLLACELGAAGCDVLVLEREEQPGSPWRTAPLGLRGLSVASAETFDRRGLLPALLTASGSGDVGAAPDAVVAPAPRSAGHVAGIVLDPARVDTSALPFRLPGPAMDGVMTSLAAVESVLTERATALGVEIRRGAAVNAVEQDDDRVVVRAGGAPITARWLVGCDGGRSAVRGLAGFEFVGTGPRLTGYLMLASVRGLDALRPGFDVTATGMVVRMPTPGHIGLMDFDGGAFDRSRPPTRAHLEAVLRRVSGADVALRDVHLASSFTDRAMQATTYRTGRVLLAGDAAHIHSPLGGQGLNLGLGDAVNLGWKLAATVAGRAPDGLLDTYTRERHPVGSQVLDWSRAQVSVMQPGPHAAPLRALVRDLLGTRDGTTFAYRRLSGASVRYDLGADDPIVGHVAPEFRFPDGDRLGELLHDGRGLALELGPERRLERAAARWPDRLRYVAGPARDDLGVGAALVRPDGVVAWACGHPVTTGGFAAAATRWFGDPRV